MGRKITVLICGGGNGAHVLAGLAASAPDVEARVLTLYADEAERWTNSMKEGDFVVQVYEKTAPLEKFTAKPSIVTKDPAKCAPGCNMIVLVVPAFAHAQYLEALKPHIKPGTVIVGLPGQSGFEFSVVGLLGDLARQCTVLNYESLPWACRIKTFGQAADVLSRKAKISGSTSDGKIVLPEDAKAMLQQVIGKFPVLTIDGHLLGTSLMNVNAQIHPAIMWGEWHDWDGVPVDASPLFYQGISEEAAEVLTGVSNDVIAIKEAILKVKPDLNLSNVYPVCDFVLRSYPDEVVDKTNLYTVLRTNKAYQGLVHPCITTPDGKFSPNFDYRYISEDIPCGLIALKGIAEIVSVATPSMDKIIKWAEKITGKEYMVDGKVKGKDVCDSRAPQRYGINTVEGLLSF